MANAFLAAWKYLIQVEDLGYQRIGVNTEIYHLFIHFNHLSSVFYLYKDATEAFLNLELCKNKERI